MGDNVKTDISEMDPNSVPEKKEPVAKTASPVTEPPLNLLNLNPESLVQGFVLSEIFGSPKAKRKRGYPPWNSRF